MEAWIGVNLSTLKQSFCCSYFDKIQTLPSRKTTLTNLADTSEVGESNNKYNNHSHAKKELLLLPYLGLVSQVCLKRHS